MKQPNSLTAKSIFFALTLVAVLAISTVFLRAQSSEQSTNGEQDGAHSESSHERCNWRCQQAQLLEGSWDVTITPAVPPGVPQLPSFMAHGSYARGGAVIGSDRTRPFSKQHGAWEHLGGNRFAFTQVEDLFDSMGNFTGTVKIRVRLTVTRRDTFVGVSNGEFHDAAGNITQSRCATVRGARIKVEPLPDQCQGITPPQPN